MKTGQRCFRDCRGTSTLEFIVVLPALLLIFLGAVEFSRAWMTLNVVTAAAREGARVGTVTNPFDAAPAIARIDAVLTAANLAAAARTVTCSGACAPDSTVTANVTVNFATLFPIMLPGLQGPFPLRSQAVMRFE